MLYHRQVYMMLVQELCSLLHMCCKQKNCSWPVIHLLSTLGEVFSPDWLNTGKVPQDNHPFTKRGYQLSVARVPAKEDTYSVINPAYVTGTVHQQ